jgi:transposase
MALRSLARRYQALSAEIAALDGQPRRLVTCAAPQLVARRGIGIGIGGQLLVSAGGNPARLRSDGAFGMLTGTSPVPASSGKTVRHRLNRGGDRQANRALHMGVLTRMAHDARTKAYVARCTAEGKTTSEIMRCLKRYVAREVYRLLLQSPGLTT